MTIDSTYNDFDNDKYLSWEEYFMALAELVSLRSKDPRTKVGAVIIDKNNNTIVSTGYNGFPRGCSDKEFPWSKGFDVEYHDTKYAYVVHAELNAILTAGRRLSDCILYTTYSPCNECMKAIIQSGIKEVIYKHEYDPGLPANIAASRMAKSAGVILRKYSSSGKEIIIPVV